MSAGLRARVLSWLNGVQPRLDAVNVFLLRRETIPDAAWSLYRENAPYDLAAAITLLREAALDGQGDAAPRVAASDQLPMEASELRQEMQWIIDDHLKNGCDCHLVEVLQAGIAFVDAATPATSGSTQEKEKEEEAGLLGSTDMGKSDGPPSTSGGQ